MRRKKRSVQRLTRNVGLRDQACKRLDNYKQGLDQGYVQGLQAGRDSYQVFFEGTSIIIPVYNNIKALKRCVEGIMDHTDLAYEIIVIDNGSTDGLEPYLKQLDGQVRYRVLDQNIGFTGAANRGSMMAKGTTIVLLNNCMIPTQNWLDNLLICLESDNLIGMVGPLSNGLNEQLRSDMKFDNLDEMHEFASCNNESDPSRWERTAFLSRDCLLFRRELLERVGYLDEGCQESPFDEKDYCLRVNMQGYKLVCAKDTYVHFEMNKTEEAHIPLRDIENVDRDEELEFIRLDSELYFKEKWQQMSELSFNMDVFSSSIQAIKRKLKADSQPELGESVFYPIEIIVQGLNGALYWIEAGIRRPIHGEWEQSDITRLSQLDLWRWPLGEPIQATEVQERMIAYDYYEGEAAYHRKKFETKDGRIFYFEKGKKRLILAIQAELAWGLNNAPLAQLCDADLRVFPDGLPIIAPISLLQPL